MAPSYPQTSRSGTEQGVGTLNISKQGTGHT